jgi:hypothetical protein
VAFDSLKRASRSGRRLLLGGLPLAVLLALVLGAYLYDRGRRDLIAPGVRIAGVDVGGLRAVAAAPGSTTSYGAPARTGSRFATVPFGSC